MTTAAMKIMYIVDRRQRALWSTGFNLSSLEFFLPRFAPNFSFNRDINPIFNTMNKNGNQYNRSSQ